MEKINIEKKKTVEMYPSTNNPLADNIAYWILMGFIFLLPLIFSPWAVVSFAYSKTLLVSFVAIIVSFFAVFNIFKKQNIIFSYNPVFVSMLAIPVVYIISSFFSIDKTGSFVGHGYELGTASFTLLLVLISFFIASFADTKQKIFYAYLAFGASTLLLLSFHSVRLLFGANILSFGIFTDITSNTVGKWNDLGIVAGSSLILSLIGLELLSLSKAIKSALYALLVLSLIVLAVINFPILNVAGVNVSVFALIGLIALLFFSYILSFRRKITKTSEVGEEVISRDSKELNDKRFPIVSLIVFIISVIMTLAINPLADFTTNHLHVSQLDARPSWASTFIIAKDSIAEKPILGVGPEQFQYEWLLHKPAVINYTDLWNTDFNNGVGYIPSSIVTTGILGFLSWITFLGIFLWVGVKALFSKNKDPFSHYLILSSFLISLFLWLIHFLYVPSVVTLTLAFIWTGLFFSSMLEGGKIKQRLFALPEHRTSNFVATLILVFILIVGVSWGYVIAKKAIAASYAVKSELIFKPADISSIAQAENLMIKGINFDNQSDYHRALAQIELSRIQQLFANQSSMTETDFQAAFKQTYADAYNQATIAKDLDPLDYQNSIMLGTVAEILVPYNTEGAYTNAKNAYLNAKKLNPSSPLIDLMLARLEAENKNTTGAQTYITSALKLKNNYVDALYLLAQLQQSSGDTKAAIQSLESAYSINPNDTNLIYQLGTAFYSQKNYKDAAAAFNRAVTLAPKYSNALYMLGLSLYQLNDSSNAIKVFENLSTLNPDNKDVTAALARLKSGGSPVIEGQQSASQNAQVESNASSTALSATSSDQ